MRLTFRVRQWSCAASKVTERELLRGGRVKRWKRDGGWTKVQSRDLVLSGRWILSYVIMAAAYCPVKMLAHTSMSLFGKKITRANTRGWKVEVGAKLLL